MTNHKGRFAGPDYRHVSKFAPLDSFYLPSDSAPTRFYLGPSTEMDAGLEHEWNGLGASRAGLRSET